jgi:hypothetical protein
MVTIACYPPDQESERRDLPMKETAYSPMIRIKLQYMLVKWEGVITAIVALCAVSAILSGIAWLISRKDNLLILLLGLSSCYLIGKNFWRFRNKGVTLEH